MPAIGLVTMVYDDPFFLKLWVDYYSRFTERENMTVVTHGRQDYAHDIAAGCNIMRVHRREPYERMDADRWIFLSHFASSLTKMWDMVICNDVDEILVLDPDIGTDPLAYLEALHPNIRVVTPFGLEVVHRPDLEHDFDAKRPLLSQRRFVRYNGWYCKPCITRDILTWGPDGHASNHSEYHLSDDLYLFHLKWFDKQFHIDRFEKRFNMRFSGPGDEPVLFGSGTWNKSMSHYMRVAARLQETPARPEKGWDWSAEKALLRDNFHEAGANYFKTAYKIGGELREVPERFVGIF